MSYKLLYNILSLVFVIIDISLIYIAHRESDCREKKWYAIIFGSIGPRTDVPTMTKRELLRSARTFLIWTLHSILCFFVIMACVTHYYGDQEPPILIVAILCFVFPILTLICLCSSVYLFLRGIFRRVAYDRFLAESLECFDRDEVEYGDLL